MIRETRIFNSRLGQRIRKGAVVFSLLVSAILKSQLVLGGGEFLTKG